MKEIIEHTDYSYSGISDLLRESPEKAQEFLTSVDNEYTVCKERIEQLRRELDVQVRQRTLLVSCFIHAHTVYHRAGVIKKDKPLSFLNELNFVVIKRISENTIDYESIPIMPMYNIKE